MNLRRCIINTLCRYGLAVIIATLLAGCGSNPKIIDRPERGAYVPLNTEPSPCHANPGSCIHKGSYDSGERLYAQKEAERLNQMSLERLKRIAAQ